METKKVNTTRINIRIIIFKTIIRFFFIPLDCSSDEDVDGEVEGEGDVEEEDDDDEDDA